MGRYGRTSLDLTREVVAVVAVYVAYQRGRTLARDQAREAFGNARRVIDFERRLHLFSERTVQRVSMHYDGVMWLLNHYYARVHFPLTTVFVIWLFVRHRETYRWVRTWLVSVTVIALAIHVAFPLAPPRMLASYGFIDTLRLDGLHIYSANPNQSLANQFAAMPSLHFGWSVILATAFVAVRRTPWSIVAFAHPTITLIAIVATANHFWVDAGVALILAAGTLMVQRAVYRKVKGSAPVSTPPTPHGHPGFENGSAERGRAGADLRTAQSADH
jgi:PAP2 superfamily